MRYEMDGPRKSTSEETREKMRIAKLGTKREGSSGLKGKPETNTCILLMVKICQNYFIFIPKSAI